MRHFKRTIIGVTGALALSSSMGASAAAILFASVSNAQYTAEGADLASMLSGAGHTVTSVYLNTTVVSDFSGYDQVWVYDLSSASDLGANQLTNYTNIANWYNGLTDQNLILDGRIISSADRWTSCGTGLGCPGSAMQQEDSWIQNYAAQLDARGGGMLLGTDHNVFHSGINNINQQINISLFSGYYAQAPYQATVDPLSPLFIPTLEACGYNSPTTSKCINDNSSTGIVPSGLQANGQELTPLAWHGTLSQASANAAVSTTIGSITFGTCGEPGQEPCPTPAPGSLALLCLGLLGLGARRRKLAIKR